jgi:hypothetical protein
MRMRTHASLSGKVPLQLIAVITNGLNYANKLLLPNYIFLLYTLQTYFPISAAAATIPLTKQPPRFSYYWT